MPGFGPPGFSPLSSLPSHYPPSVIRLVIEQMSRIVRLVRARAVIAAVSRVMATVGQARAVVGTLVGVKRTDGTAVTVVDSSEAS